MNEILTPDNCRDVRDRYIYITSHFKIKKQSDFAIRYEKVFNQKITQSTIAHNFKRFNICKSENGYYTVNDGESKIDELDFEDFLADNVPKIDFHTTRNIAVLYIKHGLEEELSFLISEHYKFKHVAIIPGYGSVVLFGTFNEIKKFCFYVGINVHNVKINEITTVKAKKAQRKE